MAKRQKHLLSITTAEAITKFLELVLRDIIKEQRVLKFRDTGASAASLNVVATDEGGHLEALPYLRTNFKGVGRKPGTMPPVDNLLAWTKRKAPNINPYALAKKMAAEGNAVYRGDRKGIDIAAIKKAHRPQFIKDSRRAVKDKLLNSL